MWVVRPSTALMSLPSGWISFIFFLVQVSERLSENYPMASRMSLVCNLWIVGDDNVTRWNLCKPRVCGLFGSLVNFNHWDQEISSIWSVSTSSMSQPDFSVWPHQAIFNSFPWSAIAWWTFLNFSNQVWVLRIARIRSINNFLMFSNQWLKLFRIGSEQTTGWTSNPNVMTGRCNNWFETNGVTQPKVLPFPMNCNGQFTWG